MDRGRTVIDDERKWRQRHFAVMAARVGGLAIALLGVVLAKGGVVVDEPFPVLGSVLVVLGIADSFIVPKALKKLFDAADRQA